MGQASDFVNVVFSEYGLAMALSLIFNMVAYFVFRGQKQELVKLYESEKEDRKEAWKAHNKLVEENNEVLKKLGEALVRIQERVR